MPSPSVADPFALADVYRKAGWVGTVPVPLGVKWPPPTGFTGADGRWPEVEDITRWSKDGPQNIALRLPPNVVALDVDEVDAFAVLMGRLGPLPATWRAHSGAGRPGHLYFRLPAGTTSEGWLAPCAGVDLLRHGHRYSVVWPSLHPSGSTYAWASPGGSIVAEGIPAPGSLPELPAAWIAHLAGDVRTVAVNGSVGPTEPVDTLSLDREGVPGLGVPIPHGLHDEVLKSYVASLAGRGFSRPEAWVLTQARIEDAVGVDPSRPFGEHDFQRWWAGAYRKYALEPLTLAAPAVAPSSTVVDWRALWGEPDHDDWILRPLIAAGRSTALYSAPKVGKSVLMLDVAVSLARGVSVLGMDPIGPTRVLYVDFENHLRGDVRRRLQDMGREPGELENLRYLSFPAMSWLDGPAGAAELLAVAQQEEATVVVIDTVVRTVAGEENSNDTWKHFYNHTGKSLKGAGIAYVRLDHSGKDETKGMRGGSNKSSDVDMVWRLSRISPDGTTPPEFIIECEAPRVFLHETEMKIAFRRQTEPLRHEKIFVPSYVQALEARMARVWAAMDEAGLEVNPNNESGKPRGIVSIAGQMRSAGLVGKSEVMADVAKTRWAVDHSYGCARPHWAPTPSGEASEALDLAKG